MARLAHCLMLSLLAVIALVMAMPLAAATALDLQLTLDEQIADTVTLRPRPFAVLDPASRVFDGIDVWRSFGDPPPVILQLSQWRLDATQAFGVSPAVALPVRH